MGTQAYRMVIDDPTKIDLLTADMKKLLLEGARKTVNIQAGLTRKNAITAIKNDFTMRNDFTTRQIQFTPCKTEIKSLHEAESHIGATKRVSYMERQETGGAHTDPKGGQLAIPTAQARDGSMKNPVSKNLRLKKARKSMYRYKHDAHGSGKSSLVSFAAAAEKDNELFFYNKNIVRVTNFKKIGDKIDFKFENVYFRQRQETTTRATRWLERSHNKPAKDCQSIFNSVMNKIG